VLREELQEEHGVGLVVLGPARVEGLAEAPEGAWVYRVDDDEGCLEEGVDEGPARGLYCDANPADLASSEKLFSEAPLELGEPEADGLWRVIEAELLETITARFLERHVVVIISPVDAHEGGQRW